jgi:hypothetical protein
MHSGVNEAIDSEWNITTGLFGLPNHVIIIRFCGSCLIMLCINTNIFHDAIIYSLSDTYDANYNHHFRKYTGLTS